MVLFSMINLVKNVKTDAVRNTVLSLFEVFNASDSTSLKFYNTFVDFLQGEAGIYT